jgi:glutamyl-tRNA reductase
VDRIGVVGASYRTTDISNLATATLPDDFGDRALVELARLSGFTELVYLGTCNRVEFYFRGDTRIHTPELLFHLRRSLADLTEGHCQLPDDEHLYVHYGRPAVRHLFRVTAALDSMMVGEAQITGQAKEAHERAHEIGLLSGILDQTFHEAFHLAKRIRTETELARRPVSLVTLVERRLADHLAATSAPVLILGAGEMARQSLRLVRASEPDRKVLVANRSMERAEEMVADQPHTGVLPLDSVLVEPPRVGLVVAATSAPEVILTREQVAVMREHLPDDEELLVIDLAMPPNVSPVVEALAGVTLLGIEEMRDEAESNRQRRMAEMDRCEKLVEHQLTILRRRVLDRELSPAAKELHRSFREVAQRAVEYSLNKDLSHLSDADRKAVNKMTDALVKRLVQVPLRGLKGAAWHHSAAVIDGFLQGLDSDRPTADGGETP